MALFTDAQILTLDDLLPLESSLIQVASSHGINVQTKIDLAVHYVGERLLLWLMNTGRSDPQWLSRRTIRLSTVVVTPALRRWLCYESLSRFFAEAYNVQLNTRFQAKWTEYQQQAQEGSDLLLQAGIGIVFAPLPQPLTPLVSIQTGNAPAQSMLVQVAWIGSSGDEGALSPVEGVLLGAGSGISVQMAEGALAAPAAAVGWNVYVASNQGLVTRQNGNPLIIGSTWNLPASGLEDGIPPGHGQAPDAFVPVSRSLRRG